MGGHGLFAAVVDAEAGVFPREEVGEFLRADEFGVAQGVEEAVAEDATEDAGDGEHELAVGNFVADGGGDPLAGGANPALVARGAEVAAFAGEGEEAFVAAVGALEAGEARGEVAAAEEGLDGGRGVGAEWAEGLAVVFFVVGEEVFPAVVDELPEGRGAGAARDYTTPQNRRDKCLF